MEVRNSAYCYQLLHSCKAMSTVLNFRCTYWISFCTTGRKETWGWRTKATWQLGQQPSDPGSLSCLEDTEEGSDTRLVPQQLLSQPQHIYWSLVSSMWWLRQPRLTGSGLQKHNWNAASELWHLTELVACVSEYFDSNYCKAFFHYLFICCCLTLHL